MGANHFQDLEHMSLFLTHLPFPARSMGTWGRG